MGSPSDLREFDVYHVGPPYNFDDDDTYKDINTGVRVTIGFIIAGALILIKESLYSVAEAIENSKQRFAGDHEKGLAPASNEIDLTNSTEDQTADQETNEPEVSKLPELDENAVVNLFNGRGGTFNPANLDTGNTTPLFVAQNDNSSSGTGSINPFLFPDSGIAVTPLVATPTTSSGSARAVVNGDSLIIEGDDPGPYDDGQTGDDSDNTPDSQNNRAPYVLGPVTLKGRFINQTTTIAAAQLLLLSSDADGDELVVSNLSASSGTLSSTGDGLWHFVSSWKFTGDVMFTYDVSDGELGVPQIALLKISDVPGETVVGTEGNDVLIGTLGNDIIDGLAGDDVIHARGGDDIIDGGSGNDRILGGDGDDTIYGSDGNDIIFAGGGDDVVFAGRGNDTVFGEDGADSIFGESGDDSLNGGNGSDIIEGGEDNDQLRGESGNDLLDGGDGEDQIFAGDGDDIIIGGNGADVAHGDADDDLFIALANDGDDDYHGDDGHDTYDLSRTSADATIDLTEGTAVSSDIGSDHLTEIEHVIAGQGDDIVTGDTDDNTLSGEDGDDLISADDGEDTIIGGSGHDTLHGEDGDDLLYGDNGNDNLSGRDGDDLLLGGGGNDNLDGEDGNDLLLGGSGNDNLDGDDGNDLLYGGSGNDRLYGEDGDDQLYGDSGNDRLYGDDGHDTIVGGLGNDQAHGGKGNDLFIATASDGDDTYRGDDGVDTYDLSQTSADATVDLALETAVSIDIGSDQLKGFENVIGGDGNDTLMASTQVNVFAGGSGSDTFVFRSTEEAGLNKGYRDHIEDFEIGDKIDISFIDADEDEEGNQDFEFVLDSNAQLDKASLVLRYEIDEDDEDAINTILSGFTNDDQLPDFEVSIRGRHNLDVSDFNGVNAA